MQTKNLYQQIHGLSSLCAVSEVEFNYEAQGIRVRAEYPRGTTFRCPN